MRVPALLVALAVAWIGSGTPLLAEVASTPAVRAARVISPDGAFAITFPCKGSEVMVVGGHDAPVMACIDKGLVFGAGRAALPAARSASSAHAFEMFRDMVRTQFGVARVQELSVSGHRAFAFICDNSDGQPCKLVIEMASGPPIMLTGGDNPAGTATAEIWHQNSPRVSAFFGTLELLAK